jgi:hypothetical protein
VFRPDLSAWEPWHPRVMAQRLAGVGVPWYVAAGWALDLFLGRETREHGDIEIGVPADGFGPVAERFGDCDFFAVAKGQVSPYAEAPTEFHQTWARERATGKWRFDAFREPADGDNWICRRNAAISLPYHEVIAHTPEGISYLQPEIALLFKAKNPRAKDESDFARVLPMLEPRRRAWLRDALANVHPGHRWIAAL